MSSLMEIAPNHEVYSCIRSIIELSQSNEECMVDGSIPVRLNDGDNNSNFGDREKNRLF